MSSNIPQRRATLLYPACIALRRPTQLDVTLLGQPWIRSRAYTPHPIHLPLPQVSVVQISPFLLRCERYAVEFDAEIAAVDTTQERFVVRMQQSRGDVWLFKELCYRILPAIRLENLGI
jgi:hypothetical protein